MRINLLRSEMAKNGLTQACLAEKIGMSKQSLSRKMQGKREFRLSEVCSICQILNIGDPAEIFLPPTSQIRNERQGEEA